MRLHDRHGPPPYYNGKGLTFLHAEELRDAVRQGEQAHKQAQVPRQSADPEAMTTASRAKGGGCLACHRTLA